MDSPQSNIQLASDASNPTEKEGTMHKHLVGTIDKVRAARDSKDEVMYLEATIHLKHDHADRWRDNVTTDWILPMPVGADVTPGDIVIVSVATEQPTGIPFKPALTVGQDYEDDEDDDE